MLRFYKKLQPWHKVLMGMFFGVAAGLLLGEQAQVLEPMGTLFLKLIRMLIIPLICFTLIYGITNLENTQQLKRIGIKAIGLFFATALFAVGLGIIVTHILKPGVGQTLTLTPNTSPAPPVFKPGAFFMDLIPDNALLALAHGNILQVVFLSFFVGFVLNAHREKCPVLIDFTRQGAHLCFSLIQSIMRLAPLGIFGYMAFMVGTQGTQVLATLGQLIASILAACLLLYICFGLLIFFVGRLSPWPFYKKILPIQLLAFSTSSSKAVITVLMDTAHKELGVSKPNSRFLIPLATALNMDGGAIYQGACALFFAQVYGLDLTLTHYLTLLFTCTLASIGGAGIPGGALLFLGVVLNSIGLPLDGVLLIASIDRILDMITTSLNVTGDACATLIIDRSEGTLDEEVYSST